MILGVGTPLARSMTVPSCEIWLVLHRIVPPPTVHDLLLQPDHCTTVLCLLGDFVVRTAGLPRHLNALSVTRADNTLANYAHFGLGIAITGAWSQSPSGCGELSWDYHQTVQYGRSVVGATGTRPH
jgi:hypothetical protein